MDEKRAEHSAVREGRRGQGAIGGERRLLTLGHGTASADELATLIAGAGIESIVDVRAFPGSRRQPHFGREEMERWVPAQSGSAYRWEPALGGFRKAGKDSSNIALRHPAFRAFADYMETPQFAAALDALLGATATRCVAVLCSESVWWRCHRRLIADAALLLHAIDVRHLMHDGTLRPHLATAGVRVAACGVLRYDVAAAASPPAAGAFRNAAPRRAQCKK